MARRGKMLQAKLLRLFRITSLPLGFTDPTLQIKLLVNTSTQNTDVDVRGASHKSHNTVPRDGHAARPGF